ncbi:S41 family peptidase [Maribacter sp. PR1]|uniref:S41 family peptidase n=1 Tax=Maribacter cobaltidurans TaxID=1178778 RepID=A0ABU7IVC2_9FLAO|nr:MULTISPECIES: S41 family peptidase [Maribacter]MDC6389503.1 S41 family peptidase [Maribacter sp. PR1]MEE1976892.1 S41 family peptidase [Maribacter cobaltidurans]
MKKYLVFLLFIGIVAESCNKNDDDPIIEEVEEEVVEEEVIEEEVDIQIQNFMWQTLNNYYFWQADVPVLADDRFSTQTEYETYLASHPDPENFLLDELLFSEDRFTFYSDDYTELTNLLSGISKSNGLEFGLSRIGSSDDVFGFVEYVIKDSDASTKDIKRGDYFIGVNGTDLTVNNYIDLLFGDNDTYILNMATIENNTISPNGKEVSLTKEEGLEEDPILASTVLNVSDKRIGYLMYNSFTPGSGEALNQVFGDFKSENITDLVLDLRYNSGGRGTTAQILASLIYGTNTSDLLYRTRYNDKVQALFEPGELDNNFVETTGTFNGNSNAALNTLNLTNVYVLATGASASASELVMVGLEPYMNVVHIGTTTVGKNQGSITFVDDPENGNFYDPEREDQINPENQWALQPIVSRVENSAGFSNYAEGLIPDIELEEDVTNLGTLGDPNEPLLARAIQEITGTGAKRSFEVLMPVNLISSSKLYDDRNSALILDNVSESLKNAFKKVK